MTTKNILVQTMEGHYTRMSRLLQQRVAFENVNELQNKQYPAVALKTVQRAPTETHFQNGKRIGVTRSHQEAIDGFKPMKESLPWNQKLILKGCSGRF
jgi:hypothetical protein